MFVDREIFKLSLDEVKEKLQTHSILLSTLTLKCAVSELNENGVYVFGTNENGVWQPIYVGKSSSRVFFERFAGHFDTRDVGTFNNMIKRLQKIGWQGQESLQDIANKLMDIGTIVTIRIGNDKSECARLEKVLINAFDNVVNQGKRTELDGNVCLSVYMSG